MRSAFLYLFNDWLFWKMEHGLLIYYRFPFNKSHSPNSLESILHSSGNKYSFIEMKNSRKASGNKWMFSEILTKAWGINDMWLIPKDQYDAIIFIDSVSPPAYLNR